MAEAVYAIGEFPDDNLLWRIEYFRNDSTLGCGDVRHDVNGRKGEEKFRQKCWYGCRWSGILSAPPFKNLTTKAASTAPIDLKIMYGATSLASHVPRSQPPSVTAGLKCPPEICPLARIITISAEPIASGANGTSSHPLPGGRGSDTAR